MEATIDTYKTRKNVRFYTINNGWSKYMGTGTELTVNEKTFACIDNNVYLIVSIDDYTNHFILIP